MSTNLEADVRSLGPHQPDGPVRWPGMNQTTLFSSRNISG